MARVSSLAVAAHQLDGAGDATDAALRQLEHFPHPLLDARQLFRGKPSRDQRLRVHADARQRVLEIVQRIVDLVRQAAGDDLQRIHALREHDVGRGLLRLHQRARRGEQLARRKRLCQVGRDPGLQAGDAVLEVSLGGEHQDGDVPRLLAVA